MKLILTLLLAIPYVLCEARKCIRGSARVDFVDGVPTSFKARGRAQMCPEATDGCGAVRKFGRSFKLNEERTAIEQGASIRKWATLDMGCVPNAICRKVVGGDSGMGCRYANYAYGRYAPMSCNATRNYDSATFRQNVRLYYACCNSDDCFKPDDNTDDLNTTCEENVALGEYITSLHNCWNAKRAELKQYLECSDEGQKIVTFKENCRDAVHGDWDRTTAAAARGDVGERCRWINTCSTRLQTLIQSFGECACGVAKAKDFTGEAITDLIGSYWNEYCGQIKLSCAATNYGLFLRNRRRRRRIKFKIKRARDYVTDEIKAAWKQKMADLLRINLENNPDDIQVTLDEAATTRRLLEESTTPITIDIYGDDNLIDTIETDACNQDTLRTTFDEAALEKISCDYDDVEQTIHGSDASATSTTTDPDMSEDAASVVWMVAVVIGVMGYFMQ